MMQLIKKILVCDDDEQARHFISSVISKHLKCEVSKAHDGAECIDIYDTSYDLVFLDLDLPDIHGLSVLKRIRNIDPSAKVIIVTGNTDIQSAVTAMQRGAIQYLTKPLRVKELRNILDDIIREKPKVKIEPHFSTTSTELNRIYTQLPTLAKKPVSIVITGESGTGKEILAQKIHQNSGRSGPFIAVNSAAIPINLAESELFGHMKGSFTGAERNKTGKIEAANLGTLFLDEIGDLPYEIQLKLLRTLQEKTITPVGSNKAVPVDFRIISATSLPLRQLIDEKKFREDLFYRLADVEFHIPSLRQRKEDIKPLIDFFCKQYALETSDAPKSFTDEAIRYLTDLPWRGNIRELRSTIRRLNILCEDQLVTLAYVQSEFAYNSSMKIATFPTSPSPDDGVPLENPSPLSASPTGQALSPPKRDSLASKEEQILRDSLEKNMWNIRQTAVELDISRSTLYRKMQKYKISRP